jgi:hypothetical protein
VTCTWLRRMSSWPGSLDGGVNCQSFLHIATASLGFLTLYGALGRYRGQFNVRGHKERGESDGLRKVI